MAVGEVRITFSHESGGLSARFSTTPADSTPMHMPKADHATPGMLVPGVRSVDHVLPENLLAGHCPASDSGEGSAVISINTHNLNLGDSRRVDYVNRIA